MSNDSEITAEMFLGRARVTVVSALAWRAIAELSRRHAGRLQPGLVQFHPGISVYGVIRLQLIEPQTKRVAAWVDFNLGGPSGTYTVAGGQGRRPFSDLLGEAPSEVIDDIEVDMGLARTATSVPPSSGRTIGLRLVASLLERLAFEPIAWRASLATWDWSGGEHVSHWNASVLGYGVEYRAEADLDAGTRDRLRDLVLVHASPAGQQFDEVNDPHKRAVAVDLTTGRISLLTAGDIRLIGECKSLYVANARQMRRVVAHVEGVLQSELS